MNAIRRLTWALAAAAILTVWSGAAGAAITDNLVSYWPMDGAVTDTWGGFTSTHTGGPENYAAAKFGQGILLDGGSEQIEVQEVGQYDFGAMGGGMSISAWFTVNNFDTSWQALVAKGEGSEFRLHRSGGSNNLAWNAGGGGDLTGNYNVNDGALHHVAVTHDGVNRKEIWVDGVMRNSSTNGSQIADNNQPLMIGENPDAQNREWEGIVDDVAIWGRPLNSGEIGQIWNGGTGNPISAFMQPIVHEVAGDNTIGTETLTGTQSNETFGPAPVGRFVRLGKVPGLDGDSRFHLSELEAFGDGVTPDNAGAGFFSGGNLSNNELADNGTHLPTTTAALEHGNHNSVHDDDFEGGAGVWSTANGLIAPDPRFTLDLGSDQAIGTVRGFPRNDGCCSNRWRNLQLDILADDGSGNPGAVVFTLQDLPDAGNVMKDYTLQTLVSADLTASLTPWNGGPLSDPTQLDFTYVFELSSNDQIVVDNPDPSIFNTILDINNAHIVVETLGPLAAGEVYQLLSADQLTGQVWRLDLPPGVFPVGDFNVTGAVTSFIPEPTTLLIWSLLAGLAIGAGWRRRK